MKPVTQKQLLNDIQRRLYWLSGNMSYTRDEATRYNYVLVNIVGSITTYLEWYDRTDFLAWFVLLDINKKLKSKIARYFRNYIDRNREGEFISVKNIVKLAKIKQNEN